MLSELAFSDPMLMVLLSLRCSAVCILPMWLLQNRQHAESRREPISKGPEQKRRGQTRSLTEMNAVGAKPSLVMSLEESCACREQTILA